MACHATRPQPRQQQQAAEAPSSACRQLAAGVLGAAAALTLLASPPALAVEPFLKATGAPGRGLGPELCRRQCLHCQKLLVCARCAVRRPRRSPVRGPEDAGALVTHHHAALPPAGAKGPLVVEEENLFQLRQQMESEVRCGLQAAQPAG